MVKPGPSWMIPGIRNTFHFEGSTPNNARPLPGRTFSRCLIWQLCEAGIHLVLAHYRALSDLPILQAADREDRYPRHARLCSRSWRE